MLRRLLPSAALRLQTHTPARSSAFRRMLCTARSSNDGGMQTHFRNSQSVHPLGIAKKRIETVEETGEWINPTTNHVWSRDEIKDRLEFQPRHQPENLADRACIGFLKVAYLPCLISQGEGVARSYPLRVIAHDVRSFHPGQVAYWTFNKVTGYEAADPTPVCLTGLQPQPSRLEVDLPLTRASPALDRTNGRSSARQRRVRSPSWRHAAPRPATRRPAPTLQKSRAYCPCPSFPSLIPRHRPRPSLPARPPRPPPPRAAPAS